jgi:RAD54-like protein 2
LQYTTAKAVLIVVPINTIQNWSTEFRRWCPNDNSTMNYHRAFELYVLNETSKKLTQRAKIVQNWSRTGGTLIMGYEMFRLMVTKKGSSNKSTKATGSQSFSPMIVDLEEEDKSSEIMDSTDHVVVIH